MIIIRKIALATAVVSTAVAIGFLMQRDADRSAPLQSATPVEETVLSLDTGGDGADLDLQDIILTSASDPGPLAGKGRAVAAPTVAPRMTHPSAERSDTAPAPIEAPDESRADCPVTMEAVTRPGAMVRLDLHAPCQPLDRVTFHHEGMTFTDVLDANGAIRVDVPALQVDAVFIAALPNGEGAITAAEVPALKFLDRAVLQWSGIGGFEMHALEYGADFNTDGHIWSGHTASPGAAERGRGGFLTLLGDDALLTSNLAQVYTYPSATARAAGEVDLSIEVEVTRTNCTDVLKATSLQTSPTGKIVKQAMQVPMPGCDAVGDFLVLNNPANDLKLASN